MNIENLVVNKEIDEEETFMKDGLLHCKKCGEPREGYMSFMGKERKMSFQCKCQAEAYEKRQKEIDEQEKSYRIARLKVNGIQDKIILSHTFEADDMENLKIRNTFLRYCDKWSNVYKKNMGLLLYGDVGNGKTFYAHAIGNRLINNGVPVLMTDFLKILNKVQGFDIDRNEFYNEMNSFKLIVIDDFGAERNTDYALEQVYNVIDQRYKDGQPLIVTTNLSLEEMKNAEDIRYKRIYDRLLEMCVPIGFTGDSKRKVKAKKKFGELAKILEEK